MYFLIGYYNKPNFVVCCFNFKNYDVINYINSLGMRGCEENLKWEIVYFWVVGSSNTFGGFVEDDEVFVARMTIYGYLVANLVLEGHNMFD